MNAINNLVTMDMGDYKVWLDKRKKERKHSLK